ncbi:MAG: GMC oxidoreductase, partial [Lautropia sp.]
VLLMRSGIGDAADLQRAGIPVVAHVPGVGRNLHNHLMILVATHLPRRAVQSSAAASWAFTVLRYSSGLAGCPPGDMQIFPINRTAWHALGRRIGAIGLCLYKPFATGEVRLNGASPSATPVIRFNMLADPRDTERMVDGLGRVMELFADPGVAATRNEVFLPDKALAGRMATPTLFNRLRTALISGVFDSSAGVRRRLLGDSVVNPAALAADRDRLLAIVRAVTAHVHHVCGTCRIGASDDPLAVVDSRCRVRGVDGLRVVDASVMPSNVSANTHLAVMMIGEKAASMILEDRPT